MHNTHSRLNIIIIPYIISIDIIIKKKKDI